MFNNLLHTDIVCYASIPIHGTAEVQTLNMFKISLICLKLDAEKHTMQFRTNDSIVPEQFTCLKYDSKNILVNHCTCSLV